MASNVLRVVFAVLGVAAAAGVTRAEPTRPICQHPDNPHYFLWRGRAVALITSAEHYGAVLNRDFDFRRYLETLQRDGLNYTRVFAGTYVEPPGAFGIQRNTLAPKPGRFLAPWARSAEPGYAGGGNKFDLDRFSPDYLARLKAFISEAGRRGVVVELTLFCSTYSGRQWAIHPLNPRNNIQEYEVSDWRLLHTTECPQVFPYQEKLVRWLVEELVGFDNLFFEIQNEPWSDNHTLGEILHPYWVDRNRFPNAVEITLPRSVGWQRRIAWVIAKAQANREHPHLTAQNISNFRLAVRDTEYAPEVDLLNFHYAFPEAVTWNAGHAKVIGYDETGFAGRNDSTYQRQAWRFIMAGGGLFNHLDYSFTVGHEDGEDTENQAPGGGSPLLRQQLGALSHFLHRFDLARLRPDRDVVVHCPGASSQVLGIPGQAYAVYLEGRGETALHMKLPPEDWSVQWLRLDATEPDPPRSFAHTGGVARIDVPAFRGGAALRLERR